jgi:hypothetical protein
LNDHPIDEERRLMIVSEHAEALDADEEADLALLAELLADPSTWVEPRTGLEDDVVDAVIGAAGGVPTGASRPAPPHGTHRVRRMMFMTLAAAAALALILGGVAVARRTTSPDYRAHLDATGLVPGARGDAEVTHNNAGFRVRLYTRGLPRLPGGQYYEAWIKAPGEGRISIGTFSSSDGRVTLWSGESPKDATLSVTIESADDNQLSSGKRVLTGPVRPG